jgi:hypothetical protein
MQYSYILDLSVQAQYSRSCPNLRYNSSLDTWTVVRLTAAKFKPLITVILKLFICCGFRLRGYVFKCQTDSLFLNCLFLQKGAYCLIRDAKDVSAEVRCLRS